MPKNSEILQIPYPVPTDAQTLFPTTAQQAARRIDQLMPVDNQVTINGQKYQATGVFSEVPNISWTPYAGGAIQVGQVTLKAPYTPPPGYMFLADIAGATTYAFAATASTNSTTVIVRILQIKVTGQGVTSIAWRLVKAS